MLENISVPKALGNLKFQFFSYRGEHIVARHANTKRGTLDICMPTKNIQDQ
jgi:hypothetical protein